LSRKSLNTTEKQNKKSGFRFHTFTSLQYHDFRFLITSTFFTSAGNWIQQVTLGWLAYEYTNSAFLTGAVTGIRALPFLFMGPIAGVITDRMDRKRLLIAVHLLLSLLGLSFALLIYSGNLQTWHIFVFSMLSGAGWASGNPVRQALVPNLVPQKDLMNAIALNSAAFNITRMLGPAVGGILIVAVGPATNFFIQAISFFLVTLIVLPIRIPNNNIIETSKHSFSEDFIEGVRYVVKEKTTLALVLLALVPSIFMMPFTQSLMPVFSKDILKVDANGLGYILSSMGLGAFIGTLILASLGNFTHKGKMLFVIGILAGLSLIVFSQTKLLIFSMIIIIFQGAFQMIYHSTNNTIIQTITPNSMRGRVMSIYMLDHGLMPVGALIAGGIAQFYGADIAILIGGTITFSLFILGIFIFKPLWNFKS